MKMTTLITTVAVAALGVAGAAVGCSSTPQDPKTPGEKVEDGVKETGKGVGQGVKQGAEKTKEGAEKAYDKTKDAVTPDKDKK